MFPDMARASVHGDSVPDTDVRGTNRAPSGQSRAPFRSLPIPEKLCYYIATNGELITPNISRSCSRVKVTMTDRRTLDFNQVVITAVAGLFFVVCTWTSYARWANFEYRTFDLAYYVQAIWQLIHGRFQVSVEPVPLLGNHLEPIVLLFAPLFALFRHPMLFVVVQNAALAAMAPIGHYIAKRLGFDGKQACLLSIALLLTPAAGYIALHEFHPEALTAPLLLLMVQARLSNSVRRHWLWFIAVLACKENMALLLAAYCAVHCIIERTRGFTELRNWYVWPMTVAILWFVLCSQVITPAL